MAARKWGQGKTPQHTIRVEDDVWTPFGEAVQHQGEPDRSFVLREFMRWYARLPGAKLPSRPSADWTQHGHGPPESSRSEQV